MLSLWCCFRELNSVYAVSLWCCLLDKSDLNQQKLFPAELSLPIWPMHDLPELSG